MSLKHGVEIAKFSGKKKKIVGTHSKFIFFKQTVNLCNVGSIPTPSANILEFGGVEMLV